MRKKFLTVMLSILMVFSMLPVSSSYALSGEFNVNITLDGKTVDNVVLPVSEKVQLVAESNETDLSHCQWQIKVNENFWVNIDGADKDTLDLSYGMVASLLVDEMAQIRFVGTSGIENAISEPVTVTVQYEQMAEEIGEEEIQEDAAQTAPQSVPAVESTVVEDTAADTADEEVPSVDSSAVEETPIVEEAPAIADAPAVDDTAAEETQTPTEVEVSETEETETPAVEETVADSEAAVEPSEVEIPAVEMPAAEEEKTADVEEVKNTEAEPEISAEQATETAIDEVVSEEKTVDETVITKAPVLQAAPVKAKAFATLNAMSPMAEGDDYSTEDTTPATPALGTYSVVINYAFENGTIAADSYVASLAAGTSLSNTVTFPTVQGYAPYLYDVQQDSITLNITAISSDVTYNVEYKPALVNYTVIHYQQNLNDDNYTEFERETKQALTDSTIVSVEKTYPGFYGLIYEKPKVAADGSTLIEISYDRYYYLMNFDLDGGYGVEPVYARYGSAIEEQDEPTKAGYEFIAWETEGAQVESLPTTMPAQNSTYKAIWQPAGTANVTVVFWGENANDNDYSYIAAQVVNGKPGSKFTYSPSPNGTLGCGMEEHVHDTCGYICGMEQHTKHGEGCYTQTCGLDDHVHSVNCYDNVGGKANINNTPSNPVDGQITWKSPLGVGLIRSYYIYISGNWYDYNGSLTQGIAPAKCEKTAHTHTNYTGSCYTLTCHTHTNACYYCGKEAHAHNGNCYMKDPGLDSKLWTFKNSDTVTVAADGSSVVNVYYDRTEKTLTFKYNYSGWNNNRSPQTTQTITAKWGSDISNQYVQIAKDANSTFWTKNSNGKKGPYTNYFGIMPKENATYYHDDTNGSTGSMTYWGQDLDGNYTVKLFQTDNVGGYTVTEEDHYGFEGFTYHHGTANGSDCEDANFYYTRNSYKLTFNDGYADVKTEKSVKFEAPLGGYKEFKPAVPDAFEPGSVKFDGWYLNPQCSGKEYKLDEHKMPAGDVLLYAKWTPVSHTVKFYLDRDSYDDDAKLESHRDQTVSHGSRLESVAVPKKGNYEFVGWFYIEDGVEKAFDFANMPVNKDLKVYGKWSSKVLKPYTVQYKIQGTDTVIAAPTTGQSLAGTTKTFDAKGGTDLYADYQEGYFPIVKSHSIEIDINATEEADTNVFTFEYVQKDAVEYTVEYLDKETGEAVFPKKIVSDNRKAVVTETFEQVHGMMPDAYQKRLVVSAEEDAENKIIFYYVEDTVHAYYKITHYTENLSKDDQDNTTWTEYTSSQIIGNIGEKYSAKPLAIPGFTFNEKVTGKVENVELPASGLEFKLYYTRNSYPYQVRYLEEGTGKQLATPKDDWGKYGQVISEDAVTIEDYDLVSAATQTVNIRIKSDSNEAAINVITFYYKEKEVDINYVAVGPEGEKNFGSLSNTTEKLKVLTGNATGSIATAKTNFRFVGWYKDADCTTPLSTEAKLVPAKKITGDDSKARNVAATYYAKFEYDVADLKIVKSGCKEIDENQSFVFHIKGTDDRNRDVNMKVVIQGNNQITVKNLKVGFYTVTEESGWSWRYTPDSATKTVNLVPVGASVTFANSRGTTTTNWKWLNGASYISNNFEAVRSADNN